MIDKLKAMGIIDDKVTLGDLKKINEKIKLKNHTMQQKMLNPFGINSTAVLTIKNIKFNQVSL